MRKNLILIVLLFWCSGMMLADNGHGLWLKSVNGQNAEIKVKSEMSVTLEVAAQELRDAWNGGTVVLDKTVDNLPNVTEISKEAFSINISNGEVTISSLSDIGLLYGAYHLLRMQSCGECGADTTLFESPAFGLRILNHWDNLDGTIERGYAGRSIFWSNGNLAEQPNLIKEYARANASVGINAAVLDNVNASPKVLSTAYLDTIRGFADIMRPYGVKVYLAVNFASPMALGATSTADPLDLKVQQWWKDKCDEIYSLIPDFGGFLVKANSEGQPGPNDYHRSHAEGANMLARALNPHGGIVMWRSFVYAANDPDRAKQAFEEFKPLDGKFDDNVIIQIKNGPVDFQPREPYSPLFGALKKTKEMVELQITQEYLGHSNHIAYLATMWEEFYNYVNPSILTAASGVSNIGLDENWCGNVIAQSNWYAFGRQSWNPSLSSKRIAEEWVRQTLCPTTESAQNTIVDILMRSREAVVDYMMPIGLHHQFADNHHYGPGPWISHAHLRLDWQPPYYHKADAYGMGFNRTTKGSDAVSQYPEDFAQTINDIETCPEQFLLWFHHVTWTHKLPATDKYPEEIMWNRLCRHYQNGVDEVRKMQKQWSSVSGEIDEEIHVAISQKLNIQLKDAIWWKDGCLDFFQTISQLPYPSGVEPSVHKLDDLKKVWLGLGVFGCPSAELLDEWR